MSNKKLSQDPYAAREAEKYTHPIPSREYILNYLTERGRPASFKKLLEGLALETPEDEEALRRRLLAMVRDGQLLQNRRGTYGLINKMELISGYVVGHKEGFGFVIPEKGGGDLFLSPRQMRMVFPEDKVLVRIADIDSRGRREAIIVEVLERHTHELVGRFFTESDAGFVKPANNTIAHDILIPKDDQLNANPGQIVVISITTQPTLTTRPTGKVIRILGEHMAPGMEIDVAILNHELPHIWPSAVLEEAQQFSKTVSESSFADRADLRHLPFVTIDGEDAKDFDDAVYCTHHKNHWILYVSIADVSHYVQPNTALDEEALVRGNSVYFPERVIPMLPEALSNELCSLNPNTPRLTMTCEMVINPSGKITRYRFYESVIHSHARLTYNQVYGMLVQNDTDLQSKYHDLLPHLKSLFTLYKLLNTSRKKRGAIDFDLPETKIVFGPARKIERIVPLERNDAHRLIEECMLCANICAARFLIQHESPGLFRIHEGPSTEKLMDLKVFLGEIGLKIPSRKPPTPRDYAAILNAIESRPDRQLIQTVLLRSLSQAIYSAENKGHFGLAFDAYAHFTSPIRRYPDLIVHRAIRHILNHNTLSQEFQSKMEKWGEHCSMTERRADQATREAIDWLKCEYMLDKVGENFSGVISGVTHFGLFVMLTDINIEGLLHISMLKNDYYRFDPVHHTLTGERSKRLYKIGDIIKVTVARVNLDDRKIDFVLADKEPEKNKQTQKQKKRRKKQLH